MSEQFSALTLHALPALPAAAQIIKQDLTKSHLVGLARLLAASRLPQTDPGFTLNSLQVRPLIFCHVNLI